MMKKNIKNAFFINVCLFFIDIRSVNFYNSKFINSEVVSLEDTLERFYIIQRIDPLMRLLEKTPEHFWIFPTPFLDENGILYDDCNFTNFQIINLVSLINGHRSIKPIFHMWEELKRYKYLHDIKLVKEFSQLLFIITRYSFKMQLPFTFEDKIKIKNIYSIDAIESLSLEQILDFLDLIIEDMPAFLDKYELKSDLTWKEWINKYWPVAPIAVIAFFIKVYLNYQNQKKELDLSKNKLKDKQVEKKENTILVN